MARKNEMTKSLKLLIVESPSKIKTISKFLGADFKIMSTVGHIIDLPESKLGITIDDNKRINIEYEIMKDKENVIADICKTASRATEIYLASDPDREGEIISWHIAQQILKVIRDPKIMHRITFNEITKNAVIEAIANKKAINEHMVEAQQARRVLDRWVGYEVSPILWRKITKGLSAGRVQSVVVLLICKREEEIQNFTPEESWSIHALFLSGEHQIDAELSKIAGKAIKLKNKEMADRTLAEAKKHTYVVTDIIEKERLKNPPPPFMTSTLQQDASNKLNFPVDRTMMVAQKLYEGITLADKSTPEALITYMRTDSLRISETALDATRAFIKKEYGDKYLPKSANNFAKKGAQDAHEAIRPVDVTILPSTVALYATAEQARLYELIWKRFVACQMSAALYFQRQVLIDGGPLTFKATGSTLIFDGFLKVYMIEDEEDGEKVVVIPKELAKGNDLPLKKLDSKQHFTQPPPRYTEATLVKEMEKRGIGRPSTYVATISTVQKRNYVIKDKKRLLPTELGRAVNDMLSKNLPDIINVSFTAKMEEDLDKIAQGQEPRDKVLLNFYTKFKQDLASFGEISAGKAAITTELNCPSCKSHPLLIRFGKAGEFIGCSGFPKCTYTSNFTRSEDGTLQLVEAKPAEVSDIKCPHCSSNLIQRIGKFGPFLACPGYPKCSYIHQEKMKMKCPQCHKDVLKRRWKKGTFYGCSGYPDCKFAIFGDVIETPCPQCKSPYLLLQKNKSGETHKCPTKECGYIVKIGAVEESE